MKSKIELLAPAGGLEQLKAAVLNGADAVYFGGSAFSARQSARNFTDEEIIIARRLTKKYNVKMFCAINTLLSKSNIEKALEFIDWLDQIGIDGIIVQDIGLMELSLKYCSTMEIHTSTQMTVANQKTIAYLKELGVKRVVVPRESSYEDIKALHQGGLELEAFVHGAICISYSGQCLLSSMIGARSGNKGACAQPCRLTYELLIGQKVVAPKGHYLSPKDLLLINSIHQMIDAGIYSFKIEGRIKNFEYVAESVKYYRKAIDAYYDGQSFELNEKERQNLLEVFNREFTEGYFKGIKGKEFMSHKKPNHRGVFLGRVVDYKDNKASIILKNNLELGDKIAFWTKRDGRVITEVEKIDFNGNNIVKGLICQKVLIDVPKKIGKKDRVFKIESSQRKRALEKQFKSLKNKDKILLKAKFSGKVGNPLLLTLETDSGLTVTAASRVLLKEALQHPLDEDVLKGQMRLGNTAYVLDTINNQIEGQCMLPKSILNQMRRECIESLENLIIAKKRVFSINLNVPVKVLNSIEIEVTVSTIDQLKLALEQGIEKIFYPLIPFKGMEENLIAYLQNKPEEILKKIGLVLPRIVREEEMIVLEKTFNLYYPKIKSFKGNTLDQLVFLKNKQVPLISGGSHLNIFNIYTYVGLNDAFGAHTLSLSRELNMKGLSEFKGNGSLFVYGALPLMILEHCIINGSIGCQGKECGQSSYSLKDRKSVLFPFKTDAFCKTHVFNNKNLFINEDVKILFKNKFTKFELDFTLDSLKTMEKVLSGYLFLFKSLENHKENQIIKAIENLKKTVFNYTKGHYYRGVN